MWNFIYFLKFKFIYFNWKLITLQFVLVLPYINMNPRGKEGQCVLEQLEKVTRVI